MMIISRLMRNWRYGNPIIVVSGLPRSGTSMMMKMLQAGGAAVMTDNVRESDEDNPGGYLEHERVKDLEKEENKAWLRDARGKAIKVISHLVKELPRDNFYRLILMRRDLKEIVSSQNIMLERRAEPNPVSDQKAIDLYGKHLIDTKVYVRRKPNFELLEIHYRLALQDPVTCAQQVNAFLGGGLDIEAMATVVNPELYRNRGGDGEQQRAG